MLIEGETGVGKELVARATAAALGRETPYAAINVAGVARGVFESQMFGHVASRHAVHGGEHVRSTVDYVREGRKNNFDAPGTGGAQ